ncbi:hypothetical protein [Virgisporangium aliadipatigenens]|nr:hypothetical protein [Virgisporangium aliadipatigenens]
MRFGSGVAVAVCGVVVAGLVGGCTSGGGGSPAGDTAPSVSAPVSAGAQAASTAPASPPGSPGPAASGAPGGPASGDPPPPADATLVIFLRLSPADAGEPQTEVTDPTKLDGLPLPAAQLDRVRTAVRPYQRRGLRLFAFTRIGCQATGATLSINVDGMLVVLTGGENTACFAAEYFLAVFAVPSGKVPPGTRP